MATLQRWGVCGACNEAINLAEPHICAVPASTAATPAFERWVLLRCLQTGALYPDYNGGGRRYCGVGDVIHVKVADAPQLIADGVCAEYRRGQ